MTMSMPFWECQCGQRCSQNMQTCRKCGAKRTEVRLSESGHIEVTKHPPAKPKPPKKPRLTKNIGSGYEDSAQKRQDEDGGFATSFMDRARKDTDK